MRVFITAPNALKDRINYENPHSISNGNPGGRKLYHRTLKDLC